MKNCNRYQQLFSEYIDGDLNRTEKKEMESHLNGCSPCARKLNNIRKIKEILFELPSLKVSPEFESLLNARIRLENRRRKSFVEQLIISDRFRVPAYAFSFAIILIAIVLVVSQVSMNRKLPATATNVAIVEPDAGNSSGGLVTIYPLDRTSVNGIIVSDNPQFVQQSGATKADSVGVVGSENSSSKFNARIYQTSF